MGIVVVGMLILTDLIAKSMLFMFGLTYAGCIPILLNDASYIENSNTQKQLLLQEIPMDDYPFVIFGIDTCDTLSETELSNT